MQFCYHDSRLHHHQVCLLSSSLCLDSIRFTLMAVYRFVMKFESLLIADTTFLQNVFELYSVRELTFTLANSVKREKRQTIGAIPTVFYSRVAVQHGVSH